MRDKKGFNVIEFYDNDMSVCAQKVRLVLAAKRIEYERHHLDLRAGDQFKPDYLKLNPKAVVPTIVDAGTPIIESTVIISYLDDAYPEPALHPASALDRATMLRWMLLPDASLHDACGLTSFALAFRYQLAKLPPDALEAHCAKMPDEKRRAHMKALVEKGLQAPGVDSALRTYHGVIAAMSMQLEKTGWLAGHGWSLADITMLPYVLRLDHLGLDWFWEDKPEVGDWFGRCKNRPEYAVVEEHVNPAYVELMRSVPAEDMESVRSIVRGTS